MNAPRQVEDFVKLLDSGEPFTHANYGDGEWHCITGSRVGLNSDSVDMGDEGFRTDLSHTLIEPRLTFHGYNPGKLGSPQLARAEDWLREHIINVPTRDGRFADPDYGAASINVRWCHKEIISTANASGRLRPLIQALRERALLVIGPDHLTEDFVFGVLGADDFVPVQLACQYHEVAPFEGTIYDAMAALPADGAVSWSFGFPTKFLMWEAAERFPDLAQIDMGACWDPYCGVLSRRGYKMPTWPAAMAANLEGLT